MDIKTFYGSKNEHGSEVPSDSEDSELEDESDSGEEWLPESGLTLSVVTRMFWSKASRVHQVADTMSLNRWEAIKKALHFNDNEAIPAGSPDPLYKIRPLVDHLISKLQSIPMSEKLAVDEQIVPFKGKNKNKQYLPAKPKKWGYKILILASFEGIPHNFEIYTGRIVQLPELVDIVSSVSSEEPLHQELWSAVAAGLWLMGPGGLVLTSSLLWALGCCPVAAGGSAPGADSSSDDAFFGPPVPGQIREPQLHESNFGITRDNEKALPSLDEGCLQPPSRQPNTPSPTRQNNAPRQIRAPWDRARPYGREEVERVLSVCPYIAGMGGSVINGAQPVNFH
ncbi:hypothetical protein WMY93_007760 [Mugilogobius chulae]|uniref:PiggyBac transposable element-derived protein domain-containing protein n=1 Tax=Mugilogobius chulae TaxID=88201 RepID=A0AAW0PHL1_9GOBI